MAEFLTTTGVSDRLEQIINRAKVEIFIISPYLKINDRLKGYLKDKDLMKINIHVVYGKNELQPAESTWLQNLNFTHTHFLKNLHAKCYLNEEQALITSMNLYEFSQQNNEEMGILVSRENDPQLYQEIREAAMKLVRQGEEVKLIVNPVSTPAEAPTFSEATSSSIQKSQASSSRKRKTATPTLERPSTGSCIRCGDSMPEANENRPFCAKDWRSWNRFKNDDYLEKFCHFCGTTSETAKSRPLCIDCYRKYKSILEI